MKKQKRKQLVWGIVLAFVLVVGFVGVGLGNGMVIIPDEDVPLACSEGNFIRVDGTKLVDEDGNEFLIRAMGFGNACWSNHDGPTYNHNTEDDYANLHELGYNAVRYYLNYGIFEDDSAPYEYKQRAWDWLDQNVEWAREHNIKIIFNMHYPQGGFQSAGNGMDLWLNQNDEQNRLAALWQAIAERYADEEAVLGYGLVNEPYMPWQGDYYSTIVQWQQLAQKLTNAIRKVDTNHVIFVEAAFAARDLYTGQIYQQLNYDKNFVQINDSCQNIVYEMHYYNPSEFTHMQEAAPITYLDYPNDNLAVTEGEWWIGSTYNEVIDYSAYGAKTEDGWMKVDTVLYSVPNPSLDVFYLSLGAYGLNGGTAYFDDATIDLYDADGNYVCNIVEFDFAAEQQWYNYYSADGTGSAAYVSWDGHDENGCVGITGANGFASMGKSVPVCVNVKEGYQYKLSVWVKTDAAGALLFPQFSLCMGVNAKPYTQAYLSNVISSYKEVTDSWNAPLFLGEFGVLTETYNGHGGEQWIVDMVNACADLDVGFSQHLYHMEGFGLYTNSQYLLPSDVNASLWEAILESVKPLQSRDVDALWNYD